MNKLPDNRKSHSAAIETFVNGGPDVMADRNMVYKRQSMIARTAYNRGAFKSRASIQKKSAIWEAAEQEVDESLERGQRGASDIAPKKGSSPPQTIKGVEGQASRRPSTLLDEDNQEFDRERGIAKQVDQQKLDMDCLEKLSGN